MYWSEKEVLQLKKILFSDFRKKLLQDILASSAYNSKMSFQMKDSFAYFFDLGTENETFPAS